MPPKTLTPVQEEIARVVRRLIREGKLTPHEGLSLIVWPTRRIQDLAESADQ